jgi:hypothetical protein
MAASGQDIDKLYQVPPGEFTAARNELAKKGGANAAEIKKLEKPGASAWAVNQLYWRERRVYDKLVRAAERLRSMHAAQLAGRKADVRTAELQHAAALKDAADKSRQLLEKSGDPATASTLKGVLDTLQALPVPGPPGRWTKPIQSVGFGSFAQMMKGASLPKGAAEVVVMRPPKALPASERAAAEQAAKKKERAAAEQKVKTLLAAERAAAAHLKKSRELLAKNESERQSLDERMQKLSDAAKQLQNDIDRHERERRAAEKERLTLELTLA